MYHAYIIYNCDQSIYMYTIKFTCTIKILGMSSFFVNLLIENFIKTYMIIVLCTFF